MIHNLNYEAKTLKSIAVILNRLENDYGKNLISDDDLPEVFKGLGAAARLLSTISDNLSPEKEDL